MTDGQVTAIILLVYNCSIVFLLRIFMKGLNLNSMLTEKGVSKGQQSTATEISYSRVAGTVGAVVMACFLWAIGSVIIYFIIKDPNKISKVMEYISSFMLYGTSLFVPYAVNQVRSMVKQ